MITDVKRTASLHVRRADEKVSHKETWGGGPFVIITQGRSLVAATETF